MIIHCRDVTADTEDTVSFIVEWSSNGLFTKNLSLWELVYQHVA
jgi:hypothetical protein